MPQIPTGTLTQNTARQSHSASTPPMIRPRKDPARPATWLTPNAKPRRSGGKVSAMIAVEFAVSIAPPIPWNTRSPISSHAPAVPVFGISAQAMEPAVKIAKPRLNSRALPY